MNRRLVGAFLPVLLVLALFPDCQCNEPNIGGLNPGINVKPDPQADGTRVLDFGQVEVNSVRNASIEILNNGTSPLNVGSVQLTENSADAEFSIVYTDQAVSLNPGDKIDAKVSYGPKNVGADAGKVVINSDDSENPLIEVLLRGEGVMPDIEVCVDDGAGSEVCNSAEAPELSVDFGLVPLQTTVERNGRIRSGGATMVKVTSILKLNLSDEIVVETDPAKQPGADLEIQPGNEVALKIKFTPLDGRPEEGAININNNDTDAYENPAVIHVKGAGDAAAVCVNPLTLDFGDVSIGEEPQQAFTITSCGSKPLDVSGVAVSENTQDNEFSIPNPPQNTTLQPGQAIDVNVVYAPINDGRDEGKAAFTSNDPASPNGYIRLKGNGKYPPSCNLSVAPLNIDFGAVAAQRETTKQLFLANAGDDTCKVTGIEGPTPTGTTQPGEFSLPVQPQIPMTLNPGDTAKIDIKYRPVDQSIDTATLKVASNDPLKPEQTVNMRAEGGAEPICNIKIEPAGGGFSSVDGVLNFGQVNLGSTKTLPIKVKNVGTDNCEISDVKYKCTGLMMCTEHPFAITQVPQRVLPPQTQVEALVSFTPTALGTVGFVPGFWPHGVHISTNDPDQQTTYLSPACADRMGCFVVALMGSAVEANIEAVPNKVDFGLITLGCKSPEECITIWNSGSATLTVSSIAIENDANNAFEVSNAPVTPLQINGGGNAKVCVRYEPTRIGAESATLVIQSDDGDTPRLEIPLKGEGTNTSHQTDIFEQWDEPKVDVLWAIDSSGSMSDQIDEIAYNFDDFLNEANTSNVDYHMGVIGVEINEPWTLDSSACHSGMDGDPGVLLGDPKIITRNPNASTQFGCNARMGTCCADEQEAGLEAAHKALTDPLVSDPAKNGGFMREDAKLALIMVSDEEDQSPGPVDFYVDFFKNIKGFRNDQMMDVSVIVGDPNDQSCTGGSAPLADPGHRYIDTANATGGLVRSICTQNWGRDLADLGALAFGVRIEFVLSRQAAANSIVVTVDGRQVAQDQVNGWTYDSQTNSIVFGRNAIPPQGSTIIVDYDVVCLH